MARNLLVPVLLWSALAFCPFAHGQSAPGQASPPAPAKPVVTPDMVGVRTMKLAEPGLNHQWCPVIVANDPKGGLWIAWPLGAPGTGSNIQHLNDELLPDREQIKLPGSRVVGMYGHDDGSLVYTWWDSRVNAEFGVELYIKRVATDGKVLFDTKFRGDPGAGLEYPQRPVGIWGHPNWQGATIPIACNGKQYGLFYVILQKFPEPSCHTGDEFVAVNLNGQVDDKSRSTWNASHSFWMSCVAGRDGHFYGITYADPWPYSAVRMGRYGKKPVKQDMLFPRKPHGMATRISAAFTLESGFGMAVASSIPPEIEDLKAYDEELYKSKVKGPGSYPVLLRFDETGEKARATYLTPEPINDLVVSGGRLGKDHAAVLWGHGTVGDKGSFFGVYPVQLTVVNAAGEVLQAPIEVKAPLTWQSDAATLSNGDLVWGGICDDWTPVDDPKKLYIVRVRCDGVNPKTAKPAVAAAPKAAVPPPPKIDEAKLAEWDDRLRQKTAAALKAGRRVVTFLRPLGKGAEEELPVAAIDDKSIMVVVQGNQMPVKWKQLSHGERAALAKALATDEDGEALLLAGIFYHAAGNRDEAERFLAKASLKDAAAVRNAKQALGLDKQ
ncbi:MAG: tetratricopeptide repeat protein [Planctomycetota bacterium]|nr:tetratricopeptide repeat protein [Planctomycetota bacterium]